MKKNDNRLIQELLSDIEYLRGEINTKNFIIKTLLEDMKSLKRDDNKSLSYDENLISSEKKKKISKIPDDQQFRYPNKYARKKISNEPLNLISPNRFNKLPHETSCNDDNESIISESYINNNSPISYPVQQQSSRQKNRPSVVINKFPERQDVYNKEGSSIINGENHINKIKIFCDSLPKGIRSFEFNSCKIVQNIPRMHNKGITSLHSPYFTRRNSRRSYFTCWNK